MEIAAALAGQDEPLIRQDYATMLRRWAQVYRSDGQEVKAGEIGGQGGCAVEEVSIFVARHRKTLEWQIRNE